MKLSCKCCKLHVINAFVQEFFFFLSLIWKEQTGCTDCQSLQRTWTLDKMWKNFLKLIEKIFFKKYVAYTGLTTFFHLTPDDWVLSVTTMMIMRYIPSIFGFIFHNYLKTFASFSWFFRDKSSLSCFEQLLVDKPRLSGTLTHLLIYLGKKGAIVK